MMFISKNVAPAVSGVRCLLASHGALAPWPARHLRSLAIFNARSHGLLVCLLAARPIWQALCRVERLDLGSVEELEYLEHCFRYPNPFADLCVWIEPVSSCKSCREEEERTMMEQVVKVNGGAAGQLVQRYLA